MPNQMEITTQATSVPAKIEELPETAALSQILRVALTDDRITPEKIRELLAIQFSIEDRQALHAFNEAMRAAQEEIKPVARDADNPHTRSKYTRLETLDAAIRPIYTKHGFSLSFDSQEPLDKSKNDVRIVCHVAHAAGHVKDSALEAPLDTAGAKGTSNKTGIQGLGSSVSYLRRYLTLMIFNVPLRNEDQDGNAACLTQDQLDRIDSLIIDNELGETYRSKLLETFGAKSFSELAGVQYTPVINLINAKIRAKMEKPQ